MPATVLYMSMSLDGFIAGPNAGPGNGLGDGGHRLHHWALPEPGTDVDDIFASVSGANRQVVEEFMSTGAVVAGRGTFEPAGAWGGDHHDGVPIFILSRNATAEEQRRWPLVSYVDDVAAAMAQAKQAAGRRTCWSTAPESRGSRSRPASSTSSRSTSCPVLLGQGRRLFDGLAAKQIELERTRVLTGDGGMTHLRYRVRR